MRRCSDKRELTRRERAARSVCEAVRPRAAATPQEGRELSPAQRGINMELDDDLMALAGRKPSSKAQQESSEEYVSEDDGAEEVRLP